MGPDRSKWVPEVPIGLDWSIWVQMGLNGSEGFNRSKWVIIGQNWFKWVHMGPRGSKWVQMGPDGFIWVPEVHRLQMEHLKLKLNVTQNVPTFAPTARRSALQMVNHLPLKNLYIFLCPLKSLLVTQSNLKKWCGAIAPSQMALFQAKSIFFPSGPFSRGAVYRMCSVGKGERKGNINDGHIKEASGLAYSRRSKEVNINSLLYGWQLS